MLYSLLSSAVVQDLKLVPVVFEGLGLRMARREVMDLLQRLDWIHAVRRPQTGVGDLLPDDE